MLWLPRRQRTREFELRSLSPEPTSNAESPVAQPPGRCLSSSGKPRSRPPVRRRSAARATAPRSHGSRLRRPVRRPPSGRSTPASDAQQRLTGHATEKALETGLFLSSEPPATRQGRPFYQAVTNWLEPAVRASIWTMEFRVLGSLEVVGAEGTCRRFPACSRSSRTR